MSELYEDDRVEPVFYEISTKDQYSECRGLVVEAHENDEDYPISLEAVTVNGRTIGVVLPVTTIRRIIAEAYVLGII